MTVYRSFKKKPLNASVRTPIAKWVLIYCQCGPNARVHFVARKWIFKCRCDNVIVCITVHIIITSLSTTTMAKATVATEFHRQNIVLLMHLHLHINLCQFGRRIIIIRVSIVCCCLFAASALPGNNSQFSYMYNNNLCHIVFGAWRALKNLSTYTHTQRFNKPIHTGAQ